MLMQNAESERRKVFSLPLRVSLLLVGVAVIPLLVTLALSDWQTRPALVNQANQAMESDALTHVQLINNYLNERILDAETLTQVPSVQSFLILPVSNSIAYRDAATHAGYSLGAGIFRDKNYTMWSLFTRNGQLLLSYPTNPKAHGKSLVPPEDLKTVLAGKAFITPVFYNPDTKKASVEIYSPVFAPQVAGINAKPTQVLGFLRATLNLDYIYNSIVQQDLGNNGSGSYAFILDENGVRIADTDPNRLFTSVAPLQPDVQQQISQEERYGSTNAPPVLADSTLSRIVQNSSKSATMQAQLAGQNGQFQIVQKMTTVMPWHYFVLSPVNTVTALANAQLMNTAIIVFVSSLLVALVGLLVGRGITRPILISVDSLRKSSHALSELASSQRDAASEQMWVVDSSQVGMQSVQYYTDATQVAARQLAQTATELAQQWEQSNPMKARQALGRIIATAQYIEHAAGFQNTSNQKLETALKVATQVTEQLATGATSATDAADQLEQVVKQLHSVVGK